MYLSHGSVQEFTDDEDILPGGMVDLSEQDGCQLAATMAHAVHALCQRILF